MDAVLTEEYKGFEIKIFQDEFCGDDLEGDTLGKRVCWHSRYNLSSGENLFETPFDFEAYLDRRSPIALPLYLYDHGGITIRTTPFPCPWDSGQIGWVYVDRETVLRDYKWKRITPARIKYIENILVGEVEFYDHILNGAVYGYAILKDGKESDKFHSCWGFVGDVSYALDDAKSMVDYGEEAL